MSRRGIGGWARPAGWDPRFALSPNFKAIARECLQRVGWDRETVDDLLASGALETPVIKALLDDELEDAFHEAVWEYKQVRDSL